MQYISCSIDDVLQKFGLSQAKHDVFSSVYGHHNKQIKRI